MVFIIVAMVPPLNPPLNAFTRILIWVQCVPSVSIARCWVYSTPRSDGIESTPQVWTILAPLASASTEWASTICCIQCGSPVRSQ